MTSRQLEQTFNKVTLSWHARAIWIWKYSVKAFYPNSGQYEQLYLAKKLQEEGLAPYAEQDDFKIDYLPQIKV
jgi:hypothetical protein